VEEGIGGRLGLELAIDMVVVTTAIFPDIFGHHTLLVIIHHIGNDGDLRVLWMNTYGGGSDGDGGGKWRRRGG